MALQHFLVRQNDETSVWVLQPDGALVRHPELSGLPAGAAVVSQDGSHIAVASPEDVLIISVLDGQQTTLPIAGVNMLDFSPDAKFVVTHQPFKAEEQNHNIKVWHVAQRHVALELMRKNVQREHWPLLQWGAQSTLAAVQGKDCVVLHSMVPAGAPGDGKHRLAIKNVAKFALSPADPPVIAAYVPGVQGGPGSVSLYNVGDDGEEAKPIARKSFFRGDEARLLWNSTGTALLALATSDYDPTNKSYYGEQKLFYLASNGSVDTTVACPKEGPIHDVQWSPTGSHFIVVSGSMPPRAALYNSTAQNVATIPAGPYNTVRWNPQGRLFCLAGYGAMPGDLWAFERGDDNTCRCIGHERAPAVSCGWSPDGRFIVTATTFPRLRVDNNMQVYTHYCAKLHHEAVPVLYEAAAVAFPKAHVHDRPASPGRAEAAASMAPGQQAGGGAPATKPKAYIPPHLRKMGVTSMEGRGNFSLGYNEEPPSQGGGESKGQGGGDKPAMTKSQAKNAKRRAKKKKDAGKPKEGEAA